MSANAKLTDQQREALKAAFEGALRLPTSERSAYVATACGDDGEVRRELASLLRAHDASAGYFERLGDQLVAPALRAVASGEDSEEAVSIGRQVAHYEVIERIGGGGMGIVYKARDLRLGRTVALKFLPSRHAADPAARARLLAEAQAASALDHPNIAVVYEIGETETHRSFIAMAWYEGETLKERLRSGPLPVHDAVAVAAQIGAALAAAHEAGIIHRDVKPANVLITRTGVTKLVDFGIARLVSADSTDEHATAGTPAYMSPEQTRGTALDARTDIWSLGVVLYEMLMGRRPFQGENDELVVEAIRDAEPVPITAVRPEVPPAMAQVVARCLRKAPHERYPDAGEFLAALRASGDGAAQVAGEARRNRFYPMSRRTRFVLVASLVPVIIAATQLAPLVQSEPTANAEAYRFYQRGLEYEQAGSHVVADTLYRRALALDPDFALARARLAVVQLRSAEARRPVEDRLEQARQEAIAALRTQPGLADAHYALGLYWQRRRDYERALAEFGKARKGLPRSSELHRAIGNSYRALGRWEEAVTAHERALRLDPRNISIARDLALTYGRMRRYPESQRLWGRYIAFTPDAYSAMLIRGHAAVRWQGTGDSLAAALQRIPPDWDERGMATFARVALARLQRRPADALAALDASQHSVSQDDLLFRPHSLFRAMAYSDAGDPARARVYYDSARVMLQDSVAAHPNDPRLHIALGMALGGLGLRTDAIRAARRAMELAPISAGIESATGFMGGAAEIFASLGENDAALRLLEQLLQMPAGREASVPLLRVDPAFDRLRDDPRFQRMLDRHATR